MAENTPPTDPNASAPDAKPKAAPARARAKAPAPTHYLVLHGAVGGWEQGTIVTAEELQTIDIDRLLRLGAIAPTQEPIKDVAPAESE